MDKPRTIKNANSICLIGKPLDRDLAQATGRDVRLENDANCFVVSEATDGAGAKDAVIFGAILGTGVGGGADVGEDAGTRCSFERTTLEGDTTTACEGDCDLRGGEAEANSVVVDGEVARECAMRLGGISMDSAGSKADVL